MLSGYYRNGCPDVAEIRIGDAEVDGEGQVMLRDVFILGYGKNVTNAQKAASRLNECNGIKTLEIAPPAENGPTENGNQSN